MKRRDLFKLGGLIAAAGTPVGRIWADTATAAADAAAGGDDEEADYALHIAHDTVELKKGLVVSTTTYNGQFPGPLLRFKEGQRTVVDIHNDTDSAEQLHWHGQSLPDRVDGAAEERTPYLQPHGKRREIFVPRPAGLRFYHTQVRAANDLSRGLYSGQAGPVYIEPKHEPGKYDQEAFLTLKEFEPYFTRKQPIGAGTPHLRPQGKDTALMDIAARADPTADSAPPGYKVAYRSFAVNGKMLGHGEPLRVKRGQRVMLHVVNASATEVRSLALPGHRFKVVALDGNPVPTPAEVPVLWLGAGERISAIVDMEHPGVWVLGDLDDFSRTHGMGIVVEYADATGKPVWHSPLAFQWDYRRFANVNGVVKPPDEVINLLFTEHGSAIDGTFTQWFVNGTAYDMKTMPVTRQLKLGRRYRLRLGNASNTLHPVHLHRYGFEITRIADQPSAGVTKDVVMVAPYQTTELDFTADLPGLTLLHCDAQIDMDYGFMVLFNTV